jgi:hypothetical protein
VTIPFVEIGITAILTLGFSCTGEVILRRRSRSLGGWTQSFLVGLGVSAAALFPLSLVLPHDALQATAAALAVCTVLRLARKGIPDGRLPSPGTRWDAVSIALLAAISAAALAFIALDFRHRYVWDGFQIWASKAHVLYVERGLGHAWFAGDTYDRRLLVYPSLVPLFEALLSLLRGRFSYDALKPVFVPFHLALLVSVYSASRTAVSRRMALLATLVVALLPRLSTWSAAGGYADMPLAAFVAGTVAAGLDQSDRRALPWLIGSLAFVKSEGLILTVLAGTAALLAGGSERIGRPSGRLGPAVLVVAGMILIRVAHIRFVPVEDPTYARTDVFHALADTDRLRLVARLCLESMLRFRLWGLLWPVFALACVLLLRWGTRPERCLAAAVAVAVLAYSAIFLQTIWPLEVQIGQAYPRLLAQLAPAAIVSIVLAAARVDGASRSGSRQTEHARV